VTRHTIEAAERPLQKILCDDYLFRIPSYQRPYAWTTEQAGELFSDIEAAWARDPQPGQADPYFLGSVVLIKAPQMRDADVVDGQQRLTTLTILLCVLRDLSPAIADAAHGFICEVGNALQGTQDRFRLTLRDRDAAFFRNTIQERGATNALPDPRSLDDARARMVENARLFRERLSGIQDSEHAALAIYLVQRCYLVVVAASDQESAFRIFSVMNSRGLDLSPADILKAEIIGAIPQAQQDDYTEKWEELEAELGRVRFAELFGHIRTIHRKQKMSETLIAEFRKHVPTAKQPARFLDQELIPFGEAFHAISDASFETFQYADAINASLRHLARIDNFDWQPLAIQVFARHSTDPAYLLRFVNALERFAYGLFLTRADTNARMRRYGAALEAFQRGGDLYAADAPLQLTSDDKAGVRQALSGDIYTETRIRLPLLLRLDSMLAAGGAIYDHTTFSVEHVLPQTVQAGGQWAADFPEPAQREAWVHKLANLLLLTRRKNAQANNADFAVKKAKYFSPKGGTSNFALTNQVLAEPVWTLDVLQRRQDALTAKITQAWDL
jgi:hypothetical protein